MGVKENNELVPKQIHSAAEDTCLKIVQLLSQLLTVRTHRMCTPKRFNTSYRALFGSCKQPL